MSNYTPYTVLMCEGGRIGVMTCKRCGAAIIVDGMSEVDAAEVHDEWHRDIAWNRRVSFGRAGDDDLLAFARSLERRGIAAEVIHE